jgi:hypothetical protein
MWLVVSPSDKASVKWCLLVRDELFSSGCSSENAKSEMWECGRIYYCIGRSDCIIARNLVWLGRFSADGLASRFMASVEIIGSSCSLQWSTAPESQSHYACPHRTYRTGSCAIDIEINLYGLSSNKYCIMHWQRKDGQFAHWGFNPSC